MSVPLREWRLQDCIISFAGVTFSGGADGEVATLEMAGDDWGDVNGSDGEVTRFATNEARATLTLKLMQTSQMVAPLMALRAKDLATRNGAGVGAVQIENIITGEMFESSAGWIQRAPNQSFDRAATTREFPIRCANPVFTPASR